MSRRDEEQLDRLTGELTASDPAAVERAVKRLQAKLPAISDAGFRRAVEALCSLFYIDVADRPDLEPALERATAVLVDQGARVVPLLIRQMQGSDLKSHLHLARALGRIGGGALGPLRDLLASAEDPYARAFAAYAIGKMSCPELHQALPEVLGGLMHPEKEVRDTAARTLGKIVEAVPPEHLTPRRRRELFDGLWRVTRDPVPAVRAKALRSLGKMQRRGLLTADQAGALRAFARGAVGEAGPDTADHAFIVRREAQEILHPAGEVLAHERAPAGRPRSPEELP